MSNYLIHYGVSKENGAPGPGSGRYPKGSGERPNQHTTITGTDSPYELSNFMRQNVKYSEFSSLKSPKDTLNSGGSCHDQVMLEISELKKQGYDPKATFIMEYDPETGQGGTTHSFVTYEDDGKTCWLENAWGGREGIHKYDSFEDCLNDVKSKFKQDSTGMSEIMVSNFDSSKHHVGETLQELVNICADDELSHSAIRSDKEAFKMADRKPDFAGWATKNNIKCDDGRTIRQDAFKDQDGTKVPIVWQHHHDDPENVLGHAFLYNKPEGVWTEGFFNSSPKGQLAKDLVAHGDLDSLSIWANKLQQTSNHDVMHGVIREVSLVLSGANRGAKIEYPVLAHSGETVYDECIITQYVTLNSEDIEHSGTEEGEKPVEENTKSTEELEHSAESDKSPKDIYEAMSDEQKACVAFYVGAAAKMAGDESAEHSGIEEEDTVNKNVFDQQLMDEEIVHDGLTDEQMATIFNDAKRSTLKDSFMAHSAEYGIENIEYLFPDARKINNTPDFIMRDQGWVTTVMNGVHHTPFSRVKSIHADITEDEARALGYIKGHLKKEEVFPLLKRSTDPQTIYKKQKLDRDDIIDITDFDVVAWIKTEMRMMLNEEIARAILIGDGRNAASDDKIQETHIRPILTDTDADLYAIAKPVNFANGADEDTQAKAFIRAAIKARKDYKGSGNPTLFTTEDMLTNMLLLEDGIGHSLYKTEGELATKLRVSKIVTVPVMENVHYIKGAIDKPLMGIIVNLTDYNVGADKGGSVNMFDDFDIDYNQYKYLIETRISGALIKPKSALVMYANEAAGGNGG